MKKYSVAIIENEKGEVLLLRRSWSAPWGDFQWSLPGGAINDKETPLEAVRRELKEETGIEVGEEECSHLLTIMDSSKQGKYQTFYYKVNSPNFSEDKIILNYENDKYQYLQKTDYKGEDLIPNLDVVFDFLCKKQRFDYNVETINIGDDIQKSLVSLIQPNPFQEVFEKGLDKSKLVLKEIIDKTGKKLKKWVRASKPEKKGRKAKQEDEAPEPKSHSGVDYHSIYSDGEKLMAHAKTASPAQLATFIEKEGSNPKAKNLVDIAKKELKSRGVEEPAKDEKSPYGEPEKKDKQEKPEEKQEAEPEKKETSKPKETETEKPKQEKKESKDEKKLSKEGQEHLDLADLADESNDLVQYLPEVDKDSSISDDEKEHIKSKIYEHLGRLTHEESKSGKDDVIKEHERLTKVLKSPDKKDDKKEAKIQEKELSDLKDEKKAAEPKKEEKPKQDFSGMSDEDKLKNIKGAEKFDDGVYNPDTGEGWDGDNSLEDKHKQESEKIDSNIKTSIKNLIDDDTRVGALEMQEGPGGLGKTFTAVKELEESGYKEIKIGDKSKRGDKSEKGYVHVKGGMTPTSLFEAMHDHPNAVFVIDDAKKIFESGDALEYIKAATDTSKQTVTRGRSGGSADKAEANREKFSDQLENLKEDQKDLMDDMKSLKAERDPANDSKIRAKRKKIRDLQTKVKDKERQIEALGDIRAKQFDFKGKVLMISNGYPLGNKRLKKEMYEPLMSRTTSGQITDLGMSKEAKLHKLSTLIPHFDGGKNSSGEKIEPKNFQERKDVYDFVKKMVQEDRIGDISTRILSGVYTQKKQAEKSGKNWKMELAKQYKKQDDDEFDKAGDVNIFNHLENLIFGFD